jgi:hypothetical protein
MSTPDNIATIADLLVKIREGMAPRALRLFAAQGLLPVGREDLVRLLVLLASDPDEEIGQTARSTLEGFPLEALVQVLQVPEIESLEIDLLARHRHDDALWQVVARHPRVADQTLRWLARVASPATQDAIIVNQTRIFGCLEILEDLRANPQASPEVLRRVREFEEEFLQKATVWASADQLPAEIVPGPSIDEALAALQTIGMHIPPPMVEKVPLDAPDPDAPKEFKDAYVRIAFMSVFHRIMCALKGTREERLILVRDQNMLVVRAVMSSPKLSDQDVEQIASQRSANVEALRQIGTRQRWLRRYQVAKNLAFNPKTPPGVGVQVVRRLAIRDLGLLSRDRNVSETVRRAARDIFLRRR